MIRRLVAMLVASLLLNACGLSLTRPLYVECAVSAGCDEAWHSAAQLLAGKTANPSTVVIGSGRAPASLLHFVVSVCFPDGGYELIDVIGLNLEGLKATLRQDPPSDQHCD